METHYTVCLASYLSKNTWWQVLKQVWSDVFDQSILPAWLVTTVADLSSCHPTWQQHKQPPHFSPAVLAQISLCVCRRLLPLLFTAIGCRCWQSFSWCLMCLHRSASVVSVSLSCWLHLRLFAHVSSAGLRGIGGGDTQETRLLLDTGGGKALWGEHKILVKKCLIFRYNSTDLLLFSGLQQPVLSRRTQTLHDGLLFPPARRPLTTWWRSRSTALAKKKPCYAEFESNLRQKQENHQSSTSRLQLLISQKYPKDKTD